MVAGKKRKDNHISVVGGREHSRSIEGKMTQQCVLRQNKFSITIRLCILQ